MLKRIAAIIAIFGCTGVAWAILGSTIFYRTYNAESGLSGRVASTWGAPQGQASPAIAREWKEEKTVEVEEKGKKTTRTESYLRSDPVKIDASRVAATLHIDYRQKGLLWFSTYKVDFDGAYTFQNPTLREEDFLIQLPFPAQQAVYDNVQLLLADKPLPVTFSGSQAVARTRLAAGAKSVLHAAYRSQGLDSWRYTFSRANAARSTGRENADEAGQVIAQARAYRLQGETVFSSVVLPDNKLLPYEDMLDSNGWHV